MDYLGVVFPALLSDGQRNGSAYIDQSNNQVCVEFSGDSLSGLGTTSQIYTLVAPPAPASAFWFIPSQEVQSTSRNGNMEALEVRVSNLASPTLTYLIQPSGSPCPESFRA